MMHIPVLLKEMLSQLSPQNGGVYVDATFGAGGYSKAILESADCKVYAIDRDVTVVKFYDSLSIRHPGKIKLFVDKFSNIKSILDNNRFEHFAEPFLISQSSSIISTGVRKKNVWTCTGMTPDNTVDGVVFDIGVSSMQLDDGDRGFSFLHDGPLDMRMDNSSHINASTFVNALREEEIANTIYNYGGERHSRKIAKAIVNARKKKTIKTTFELAGIVRSVVFRGKSKIDPATRTFQAIRIWVNDELGELEKAIKAASEILNKNGKLIVITFHSLEDRIVKTFFRGLCEPESADYRTFSLLNKKVIKASAEEMSANPRARSAKLRAIQRLS
ncbi:16S rRNA (cytosine(1402)-N(4))-methyltransferase RsmH [Wolbachia endosymbiont of Ctenocephalides felis wCfeJ]|uniref:16S rRNA (cytosine(1402)-N(4))-methyltransferase RsmH n=1 Tax=Wolbachia endosymbiont of Ctenocephalides felis wCfeJ TaxID=2732594 RepID=UPI00144564EC|nr:16S rRNA (cytosine(1402)-N(4))-methyltransferase RsmH [Wolbachia endosymbiont of Ctenocephalides felis wCfeJ]WCR57954.1 MAG: Ribosomal RNA small subunit methyltransferase H [Wolbachia endosymbiont of Ctenocephalides felis wCfeJ]